MTSTEDHPDDETRSEGASGTSSRPSPVGYKRPPVHTRFKPGVSGNPSGRAKGSQNFKTIFDKILKEEVSLREGSDVRKITKAEAILRGLVVGALKGDPRNLAVLLRLAEQTGQFEERSEPITTIARIILEPGSVRAANSLPSANSTGNAND